MGEGWINSYFALISREVMDIQLCFKYPYLIRINYIQLYAFRCVFLNSTIFGKIGILNFLIIQPIKEKEKLWISTSFTTLKSCRSITTSSWRRGWVNRYMYIHNLRILVQTICGKIVHHSFVLSSFKDSGRTLHQPLLLLRK